MRTRRVRQVFCLRKRVGRSDMRSERVWVVSANCADIPSPAPKKKKTLLSVPRFSQKKSPRDQQRRNNRHHSQEVRQRSAKPSFSGSNPDGASKRRRYLAMPPFNMFVGIVFPYTKTKFLYIVSCMFCKEATSRNGFPAPLQNAANFRHIMLCAFRVPCKVAAKRGLSVRLYLGFTAKYRSVARTLCGE